MKTLVTNLFRWMAFACLHVALKTFYVKALTSYEMGQPHCGCGDHPFWLLRLVQASDFFTYSFTFGHPIVGDLAWGGLAVGVCLAIEKCRGRRGAAGVIGEAQAGVWPPAPQPSA